MIATMRNRAGAMVRPAAFAAAMAAALALGAGNVAAEPTIDVGGAGSREPMKIAVTDFHGSDAQASTYGADIAGVIAADLERSGLFAPINKDAFIQKPEELQKTVRFQDWRLIGSEVMVTGSVKTEGNGQLRVEFRLWDVGGEAQMVGRAYESPASNWRRVAHIIADAIYERITGEKGYFDSRVVFVAESGPPTRRVKRLAIMDQDGANVKFLTTGAELVLTPRFSPSTQEITYLSYFNNRPRVYLLNIDTGRQEVVGDFPGMTFAPRFSPDGNSVAMSMTTGGGANIYLMDLRSRQNVQLTNSPAIDTSPSFSPDGSQIVFESDRGGSQQLYVMGASGGGASRISQGDGRYATPVWSPRGDMIAFTKMTGGRFYIGVMRTDGSGERLLSQGYLVEGPTWAPNGRVLMFFRQNGDRVRLYSIDLTGENEREVLTPTDASDPAWSPLNP